MDKGKFVEELIPGSSFSQSIFIAVAPDIKTGKTGNPYAMFNIEDRTGSSPAKLWNVTPEQERVLFSNTFFLMSGEVDNGAFAGQVKINNLKPVDESQVRMDDFLPPLPPDHKFHYDRFIDLIKSVRHPHLKSLLRKIYGEPKTLQQFKNAVAAKSMHHSHRGGLLEHSAEVAAMCSKMCDVLPGLNRDLVVTCALLHDIGKIEEMEHGIHHGEYTADGNLLGHIVLGTQIVIAGMGTDFPSKLRLNVLHLILSHHKTHDFGSPKEPMTAEAQVLAACDELSARVFQHRVAPKAARIGAMVHKTTNGYAYLEGHGDEETTGSPYYPKSDLPLQDFEAGVARLTILGTDEQKDVVLPAAGADFLLRITGNQMIDHGYGESDLVLAATDVKAKDGAFVVAAQSGRPLVVRKCRLNTDGSVDVIPLQTADLTGEEWTVSGVVTGLVREI
jgi:3'-5' exoribonuclease